ncbi:MAG: hypothetical protein KF812_07995 [Fimbriimonadaceae bacterium]|nr:hypothetical protein [Fimbriimonadaceae bacterium]
MGQVVREIAAQENLAISADPEFDNEWMVMRSKSLDRDFLLTELAIVSNASWVEEGRRLVLRRTSESRRRAADRAAEIVRENLLATQTEKGYPDFLDYSESQIRQVLQERVDGIHPERFGDWLPESEIERVALELVPYNSFFRSQWPILIFSESGIGLTTPAPAQLLQLVKKVQRQSELSQRICEQIGLPSHRNPFRAEAVKDNTWRVQVSLLGDIVYARVSGIHAGTSISLDRDSLFTNLQDAIKTDNAHPILSQVEQDLFAVPINSERRTAVVRKLFLDPNFDPRQLMFGHLKGLADVAGVDNYLVHLGVASDALSTLSPEATRPTYFTLWSNIWQGYLTDGVWDKDRSWVRCGPIGVGDHTALSPTSSSLRELWGAIDDEQGLQPMEEEEFCLRNQFVRSGYGHAYSTGLVGRRPVATSYPGLIGWLNSIAPRGDYSEVSVDYGRIPQWLQDTIRSIILLDRKDQVYVDGVGWQSRITEETLPLVKVHFWRGTARNLQLDNDGIPEEPYLINDLLLYRNSEDRASTLNDSGIRKITQVTCRMYLSFGEVKFGGDYSFSYLNGTEVITPETPIKVMFTEKEWAQLEEYDKRESTFFARFRDR